MVLALLIFGPKRLPEIGRTLGKGLSEFRRASSELKRSFESEVAAIERAAEPPAGSAESKSRPSRFGALTAPAAAVERSAGEAAAPVAPISDTAPAEPIRPE